MKYYSITTNRELKKFRVPCIESAVELSEDEIRACAEEVQRFTAFLDDSCITWCRAFILNGEGEGGDHVEPYVVAKPVRVSTVYWFGEEGGLIDLVFGRPLVMGGRGYTVLRAKEDPAAAVPVIPESVVVHTADQAPKAPQRPPVPPVPAVPGMRTKKTGTRFDGGRSTGIPSLDRVRGIR